MLFKSVRDEVFSVYYVIQWTLAFLTSAEIVSSSAVELNSNGKKKPSWLLVVVVQRSSIDRARTEFSRNLFNTLS